MPKRVHLVVLAAVLFVVGAIMGSQAQIVPCAGSTGKEIVACVGAAYPERLKASVSLIERQANMSFLRDRIIETGRCKLLDLGLNCKRGNCNNLSLDFIAWKTNGRVEGVDIASGYDDTSTALKLQWHTYGPPDYGFPTFKAYGPVSCIEPPPPPPPPPPPAPPVDLQPILNRLTQLEADHQTTLDRLRAVDAQLVKSAVALTEAEKRLYQLEQKPWPALKCSGRIPIFGIPVECKVLPDVNPEP